MRILISIVALSLSALTNAGAWSHSYVTASVQTTGGGSISTSSQDASILTEARVTTPIYGTALGGTPSVSGKLRIRIIYTPSAGETNLPTTVNVKYQRRDDWHGYAYNDDAEDCFIRNHGYVTASVRTSKADRFRLQAFMVLVNNGQSPSQGENLTFSAQYEASEANEVVSMGQQNPDGTLHGDIELPIEYTASANYIMDNPGFYESLAYATGIYRVTFINSIRVASDLPGASPNP